MAKKLIDELMASKPIVATEVARIKNLLRHQNKIGFRETRIATLSNKDGDPLGTVNLDPSDRKVTSIYGPIAEICKELSDEGINISFVREERCSLHPTNSGHLAIVVIASW